MMRYSIVLLALLSLACSAAFADDQADVEAFNSAWLSYVAASEQSDKKALATAAKQALDTGRVIFANDNKELPQLLMNYGAALNGVGRRDLAKGVLEESVTLSEAIYGKDSIQLALVLAHLADANASRTNAAVQMKHYQRALKITAATYGKDSAEYAKLALRAGMNPYQLSKSVRGRKYLLSAADYFEESLGADSFQAGLAQFYLGKIAFSNRNFKSSTKHLLAALQGFGEDTTRGVEYQLYARALLVETYELRSMSDDATEHCVAIGKLSPLRGKADFVPLFRMLPRYPGEMISKGREGSVDFQFTVDKNGIVRNPEVINPERDNRAFEEAALAAVERFRYAPKVVDGVAVSVDGVKTRIRFSR